MTKDQERLEALGQEVREAVSRRRKLLCSSPVDYNAVYQADHEARDAMTRYERVEDRLGPNGIHDDHERPRT